MNTRSLKRHLRYVVPQIRLALIKEPGPQPHQIYQAADIEKLAQPLVFLPEEQFVAFHLDAKNQVIGYCIVSHGTLTSSLVHPREVFKSALLSNGHAIIVAHNHPAGSLTPSPEDVDVTRTLIKAGKLLGVNVIDHIIVSSNGLHSLRENMPHLWA